MQFIIRILFLIVFFVSFQVNATEKATIIEHHPKALPNLPIYDLKDREFFLDNLEGNVVILHFWATWCTQCNIEMQKLNRLQKIVRKDPIIVIPVSEDTKGVDKIKEFYRTNHLRYLVSFVDKNQKWFQAASLTSLPVTLILNGHMEHVATVRGSFDWTDDDNINRIKTFILNKESQNPDYLDLLGKQDNLPKEKSSEPEKPKKKEFPQSAITDLAPPNPDRASDFDEHINVTNTN